ncbi:MAG: hypothetical protein FJ020_06770 [Chloroflexi bacterium]|nr:hypothetical protein [Chloroflexota bacterium]
MRRRRNPRTLRGLLRLAGITLVVLPEPFTTLPGVALLCASFALPDRSYRPAPCSGVIVRRGALPA